MALNVGDKAPDFSLETNHGKTYRLSELRGKKVVLFFYPKDDTPGCTKESCEFRDAHADFDRAGAAVFGISADDTESHKAFASKFQLNYPLLADPTHRTCDTYGVWGTQTWKDKTYEGIARTTFVVDGNGLIERIYRNVNPVGHAAQVLQDLS